MRIFFALLLFFIGFFSISFSQDINLAYSGYASPDESPYIEFGEKVAIHKDIIVVSARKTVFVLKKVDGNWKQIARLLPIDGEKWWEGFGNSIALDDSTIIIGSPSAKVNNVSGAGRIYIYKKPAQGWTGAINFTAILAANTPIENEQFGSDISILGDTIAVGAKFLIPTANDFGKVYIVTNTNSDWSNNNDEAILQPKNPSNSQNLYHGFGSSIILKQNLLLVGSPNLSDSNDPADTTLYSGGVYVFEKPGGPWTSMTESAIIYSPEPKQNSNFGGKISMYNTTLAVAQANIDNSYTDKPLLFIYGINNNTDWTNLSYKARVIVDSPKINSMDVVVGDSTILIGVESFKNTEPNAFIARKPKFGWSGDVFSLTIMADGENTSLAYGKSICGNDTVLYVGSSLENFNNKKGHIFEIMMPADGWDGINETYSKFNTIQYLASNDRFGSAVAISGNYAVITAPGDDEIANNAGAAYVFEKKDNQWNRVAKLLPPASFLFDSGPHSVAIYDKHIVITHPGRHEKIPALNGYFYLFTRPDSGWQDNSNPQIILNDITGVPNERIGIGISLYKNKLLLGSNPVNSSISGRGLLYKIENDTVQFKQDILPENTQLFGGTYKFFGDKIVIGDDTGLIHSFNYTFDELDPIKYDTSFYLNGTIPVRADLSSNHLVFSSIGGEVAKSISFNGDNWSEPNIYSDQNKEEIAGFGSSISISGEFMVCSNYLDIYNNVSTGSISIYKVPNVQLNDTINAIRKIYPPVTQNGSFGLAHAIYGNKIIVGNPSESNLLGVNAGSIYIYEIDQPYVSVVRTPADSDYYYGDTVRFEIQFNEAIDVVGNPELEIFSYNSEITNAKFVGIENEINLLFEYIFKLGDNPYYLNVKNRESFLSGGQIFRKSTSTFSNRILPPLKISELIKDNDLAAPFLIDSSYFDVGGDTLLNLSYSFSEPVSIINLDSIKVIGGSLSSLSLLNDQITGKISLNNPDSVSIYFNQRTILDTMLIPNDKRHFTYYTKMPTLEINQLLDFDDNGNLTIEITSDLQVMGLEATDLIVSNGSIISLEGSDMYFKVQLVANSYGDVLISIPQGVCYSPGLLGNNAIIDYKLIYKDPTPYTYQLTSTTPVNIEEQYILCYITFSHPTRNLTAESFNLTNAVIEKIETINTELSYKIFIRAIEEGIVEISLNGPKTKDIYDNPSIDKDPLIFIYDKSAPFIETFLPSEANYLEDIIIDINFNEPVFDIFVDPVYCVLFPEECFNIDDIIVEGASISSFDGGMGSYKLGLKPSIVADISVTFPSGIAYDIAGKTNVETQVFNILNKFGVVTSTKEDEIYSDFRVEHRGNRLSIKNNSPSPARITLFDSKGMVVLKMDNAKKEVVYDLSSLSYGVYVLTLVNDSHVKTQKILITRK